MKTIRLTYTNGDSASARLGAEFEEDTLRFYLVQQTRTELIGTFPLDAFRHNSPFMTDGETRIGYDIARDQYVIHAGIGQGKTTYFAEYETMKGLVAERLTAAP